MTQPTWRKFPPEVLQRLFDAVEVDDAVDPAAALPDVMPSPVPQEVIVRCYALCLQFWESGVSRADLLDLVRELLRHKQLGADEQRHYKHLRARYKHLRFALRLYTVRHRSPFLFDLTTGALGELQDAFRGHRHGAVFCWSLGLRLLLTRPIWSIVRMGIETKRLDDTAGFTAHWCAKADQLRQSVARPLFTGREFHRMRKIVGMQVSYYDTLRTLGPDDDAVRMSRFLAAINGLMGARHDEMVADALSGRRRYSTLAPLSEDIRSRLDALVSRPRPCGSGA